MTAALGAARPTAAQARAIWEKATGQKVPFDDKLGRFYDMAHKQAGADGGDYWDPNNLKPQQHDEHMAEHMDRGDFKRWGARANMTAEEIKQLEMEAQAAMELRKNLNPPPPSSPTGEPPN